jgi:hypothetical protein
MGRRLWAAATFLVAGSLVACGGGGGDSAPPPPVTVAPIIATQPQSVTVEAGQTASFSVIATGSSPLSYQWRRAGNNIAGAVGSTYTTPTLTTSDSGATFSVVVSNSAGSVTSSVATLTVNPAPQPVNVADVLRTLYFSSTSFTNATFLFISNLTDANLRFLSTASICRSGTVSNATLNGNPLPAGADALPNGVENTLAASFLACAFAEDPSTRVTGTNSFRYLANSSTGTLATLTVSGASTTNNFSRVTTSSSNSSVVLSDTTMNGTLGVTYTISTGSTASSTIAGEFDFTPAQGMTFVDRDYNIPLTYVSGSSKFSLNLPSSGGSSFVDNFSNQTFTASGVTYVPNGALTVNERNGAFTSASGEIRLTRDGVSVGRIYGTAISPFIFVEVGGSVQPLGVDPRRLLGVGLRR